MLNPVPSLRSLTQAIVVTAGLVGLSNAFPQQAQPMPAACKLIDRSVAVAVVVCDRGTSPEQFQLAGVSACAGGGSCNAWMWTDASLAPTKAPAHDQDMPKSTTGVAAAVWIQDSKHLINLRKAK